MKLYRVTFDVTGHGAFPWDMLRYDGCFPHTTEDATKLGRDDDQERTIRLAVYTWDKVHRPTPGRWASFGWTATVINSEEV